jgi:hypothetical protein
VVAFCRDYSSSPSAVDLVPGIASKVGGLNSKVQEMGALTNSWHVEEMFEFKTGRDFRCNVDFCRF